MLYDSTYMNEVPEGVKLIEIESRMAAARGTEGVAVQWAQSSIHVR